MGLATLPTQSDGSLGRPKQDLFTVPDLEHHVPASEWNEVTSRVAEIGGILGLGDGSTADSIEESIADLARGTTKFHWLEDFFGFDLDTHRFKVDSGTFVLVDETDAVVQAAGSGAGVAKLGGAASSQVYGCRGAHYACKSDVRIRARTPTTAGTHSFGGVTNTAFTHYWSIEKGTTGWLCRAVDAGGNATVDNLTGGAIPAYAAETWYTFRVKLLQTSVEYYVNDVLIHTATTHLPTASEALAVYVGLSDAAAGNAIYIDAIDVRGTRR